MSGALPILFDTSRSKAAGNCQRERWWHYEYPTGQPVRGIDRKAMALPLATGIYVHNGLASVLGGKGIDEAIVEAVAEYKVECMRRGLNAEVASDVTYVIDEQAALIEALVRGWVRVRMPALLAEYDVLDVEREEWTALTPGLGTDSVAGRFPPVEFQSRADVLLKRKGDGTVFDMNFKTTGTVDDRWVRAWETDVQTLSEIIPIERRLGVQLGGVLIEGLYKGARVPDKDKATGDTVRVRSRSSLIYGYKHPGNPPFEEAAYSGEYTSRKGWSRFNVWQEKAFGTAPVKYWVENVLIEEELQGQFVSVPPILRAESMIADWTEQQVYAERRIRAARDAYDAATTDAERRRILNEHFPQTFAACDRFGRCAFADLCHSDAIKDDPVGSGLYIERTAHHPKELEAALAAKEASS